MSDAESYDASSPSPAPAPPLAHAEDHAASPEQPDMTHYAPGVVSPQAVYGTVVVAAIVGASSSEQTGWEIFFTAIGSVLVLWAAHVYAEAVASHGRQGAKTIGIRDSIRLGVRQSAGILIAAVIPVVMLFLGAIKVLTTDVAVDLSLWACVVALGVLGYF
ncbi:MAG: hypothetical protein ABI310_08325, partial [Microbacteriaceae bacterium]